MKKLLIIIGAGASIDFGMPTVTEIDKLFNSWASRHLPLADNERENLYTWVKDKVIKRLEEKSTNGYYQKPNFEQTLFTIQNITSISEDHSWGENHPINAFIDFKTFPEILSHRNRKIADGMDFQYLIGYLIDDLLRYFRNKCSKLKENKSQQILKLKHLFDTLKEDYELGFINLNYDNVILSTLPDLSTGFNKKTGRFDTSEFYNNKWNFCYHLHGSVHFDTRELNEIDHHHIFWQDDLSKKFSPGAGQRRTNNSSSGILHLNSNIITGLDKPNQLLKTPFKQYFSKLDQLANEADSYLFIGYGFGDKHLNSSFPIHRYDNNKIRKAVIIDWASDETDGQFYRSDNWANGLTETLRCNAILGNGIDGIPPKVKYYKDNKSFEFSPNKELPISIWYNGLMEACDNAQLIKNELK